jgi:hypothetical protein
LFLTAEARTYQRVATRALHLRQLGLNATVIAKHLGVTDKTATKALAWIAKMRR